MLTVINHKYAKTTIVGTNTIAPSARTGIQPTATGITPTQRVDATNITSKLPTPINTNKLLNLLQGNKENNLWFSKRVPNRF